MFKETSCKYIDYLSDYNIDIKAGSDLGMHLVSLVQSDHPRISHQPPELYLPFERLPRDNTTTELPVRNVVARHSTHAASRLSSEGRLCSITDRQAADM
jgi:hypothetical protein